ncbi:MAG: Undecaprenyl-diphosphatase [Chitinophagaceae bacterium]|nr:Undecaprenyl-diphosphatase [Chitinophagaceae bacterium]MDB5222772.1 Undecaprenyl-diphosphatase [Chitinophagaceae bacterium]
MIYLSPFLCTTLNSFTLTTTESIIIAIVEGITEFIPISSTGHMIIAEKLLQIPDDEFTKVFTVAIQLGAILAVVVLYAKKFFNFSQWQFYAKLAVAVLPALLIGFLFSKKIDALLDSSLTVAITMLAGGIVLLFIDKVFTKPRIHNEQKVSFVKAFIIGIWQCLAMIPGVSRSAASIIGGMQQKLTRSAAAEFSFFLAVPTMLAATVYKLYKYTKENGSFTSEQIKLLSIGNAVAFIVALLAIKFFITFLKKHGFRVWGVYRVIVGIALLVLIYSGWLRS